MRPPFALAPIAAIVVALAPSSSLEAQENPSGIESSGSTEPSTPSLALHTDRVAPWSRYALAFDGLGAVWSEYTAALRAAPARFLSFRLDAGATRERSLLARVSVEFWAMGRGLDGPYLAAGGLLESSPHAGTFAEAGYALAWHGLFVDAALRIEWRGGQDPWRSRARLAAGFTF